MDYSLLWIDLQMSGLDPVKNRILEFACVLTDPHMKKKLQGPHLIIHCDEDHLKNMDQWNTRHHTQSGLYKQCLVSKLSIQQAQIQILNFLKDNKVIKGQLCIAGNSVHQDKFFMFHHMPDLNSFLHYRILDVSSIKLVVNSKNPKLFFKKQNKHRAVDDIYESIGQMQYYLKYAFK